MLVAHPREHLLSADKGAQSKVRLEQRARVRCRTRIARALLLQDTLPLRGNSLRATVSALHAYLRTGRCSLLLRSLLLRRASASVTQQPAAVRRTHRVGLRGCDGGAHTIVALLGS